VRYGMRVCWSHHYQNQKMIKGLKQCQSPVTEFE